MTDDGVLFKVQSERQPHDMHIMHDGTTQDCDCEPVTALEYNSNSVEAYGE